MKNVRDNGKRNSIRTNTKKMKKSETPNEDKKNLYITNYQSSEGIVKLLLEKIITLAIYKAQTKEIDEQMGIFCFNNFKKQMTSLFETNFLNYTNDITNNEEEQPILWECTPPAENTWVEIMEPGTQDMDRYESSNINYLEIKKDQQQETNIPTPTTTTTTTTIPTIKNNINEKKNSLNVLNKNKNKSKKEFEPLSLNNNNIIHEVEEKSSLSGFDGEMIMGNGAIPEVSGIEDKFSESLNITDAEIKKNIDNVDIPPNDKENKDKNSGIITPRKEENNKNININNNNNIKQEEKKEVKKSNPPPTQTSLPPIKKKGKNVPIADYPFSDIPGVEEEYNHDSYEPQNVEFLRREREELIQKKIIENKLKETTNKVIKPIEENDKIKKKLIDTNRLTFDSNGNIIHFRPYKIDNLSRDFVITRNTIRAFEPPKTETNLSNKKRTMIMKKEKEKEKENKEEEIIKNVEEEKKVKEITNITNNMNTEKERFIPSGSNFQIIAPNTGVVIKENNQFKEGSKEFSKYFNKYSLQDYDKMLNDYVPLQNRTMLHNHLNTSSNNNSKYLSTSPNNNTTIKKRNSIISSVDSNNNININNSEIPINPLLSNEDQSSYLYEKDKDKSINNIGFNMNSNNNLNNPLLSSNMNSINFNKYNESNNSLNIDNSIVMKKLGTGSLKLELDSLKDLSAINTDLIKPPNKRNNIFGSAFMRSTNNKTYKIKPTKIDNNNLNDFNKKIMATKGWGNETINLSEYKDKSNLVYARHITKQQVLRELGSNILSGVKVRLPRDRKVDIKQ